MKLDKYIRTPNKWNKENSDLCLVCMKNCLKLAPWLLQPSSGSRLCQPDIELCIAGTILSCRLMYGYCGVESMIMCGTYEMYVVITCVMCWYFKLFWRWWWLVLPSKVMRPCSFYSWSVWCNVPVDYSPMCFVLRSN